ncbi:hypothetical protein HY251_11330, partial [bacterium]|nr:hypothetical protein [bacterium]
MGRSDMRRAARHRAYTIVTFMCVAIIGVGMVYLVRGAWSKRAQKVRTVLYRDPVYVLRDIFA